MPKTAFRDRAMQSDISPEDDELSPQDNPTGGPIQRSRRSLWVPVGLIALVAFLQFLRGSSLPISAELEAHVTLRYLPADTQTHVYQIVAVPVAALVVVFFRLTLGLRMLGPFRPILIAVAMRSVGVLMGVAFMIVVGAVTLYLRPRFKQGWLPYYGRLATMLSVVVLLEVTVMMIGGAMAWSWAGRAVLFPIVVLTLTTDGFARMLNNEGLAAAIWCGTTTLLAALASNTLMEPTVVRATLIDYPETLLLITSLIMLISTHFNRRYLEHWNPTSTE